MPIRKTMSIWKELYDIIDKERTKWQKSGADKQALSFEIQSNLTFLADALQNKLSQKEIVKGLERSAFDKAIKDGFKFNSIAKAKVTIKTVGDFDEFKKYVGKDTAYLIMNVYSKINSLTKLVSENTEKNYSLKIKSLFRFFVFLSSHIEGRHLTRRSSKDSASRAA